VTRTRAREERSAGGVVYRFVDARPVFLLIRDSYRNWGFPKGHLERGELAEHAALREVQEETGLSSLTLRGEIDRIDWYFRFRGRLIHKYCHFFLIESATGETVPQREEGITGCQWVTLDEGLSLVSYANAREVLRQAARMLDARDDSTSGGGSVLEARDAQ
jgi:8-oxo-dGTP pyrophosphatase MutT (NUDIX family)